MYKSAPGAENQLSRPKSLHEEYGLAILRPATSIGLTVRCSRYCVDTSHKAHGVSSMGKTPTLAKVVVAVNSSTHYSQTPINPSQSDCAGAVLERTGRSAGATAVSRFDAGPELNQNSGGRFRVRYDAWQDTLCPAHPGSIGRVHEIVLAFRAGRSTIDGLSFQTVGHC